MARVRIEVPEVNHYEVLEVASSASSTEIRDSFKRLVLEAHPDKNPHRPEWSEKRIRELIEAFDILGNEESRGQFDRTMGIRRRVTKVQEKPFFYYKKDPEARALLILHHLMNKRSQVALALLEEAEAQEGDHFLSTFLDRPDYLDCLFLLAEHLVESRQYREAVTRLSAIYVHEKDARFPRHYLDQVVERLKDLYLRKLPRFAPDDEVLAGLEAAYDMGLTRTEEVQRLRRLVQLLAGQGRIQEARRAHERLFALAPEDPIAQKFQTPEAFLPREEATSTGAETGLGQGAETGLGQGAETGTETVEAREGSSRSSSAR